MTLARKISRLLFFFLLVFTLAWSAEKPIGQPQDFRSQFPSEPDYLFRDEVYSTFEEVSPLMTFLPDSLPDCTQCEIISIVAPEAIRYLSLLDMIETSALEILYVKSGTAAADFSIGLFQMKPSFIERLERELRTGKVPLNFSLPVATPKIARRARLERIKRSQWQVFYAYAYWSLCNERFNHRTFSSPRERISFYATAYNYGFYKEERLIEGWRECEYFPYGRKYDGDQMSYGDLAASFYRRCLMYKSNNP